MTEELLLVDPTAEYCKQLRESVYKTIKVYIDAYYDFFLKMGLSKADAIWNAIEMTQEKFDKVDLTVNFDGPMAA